MAGNRAYQKALLVPFQSPCYQKTFGYTKILWIVLSKITKGNFGTTGFFGRATKKTQRGFFWRLTQTEGLG